MALKALRLAAALTVCRQLQPSALSRISEIRYQDKQTSYVRRGFVCPRLIAMRTECATKWLHARCSIHSADGSTRIGYSAPNLHIKVTHGISEQLGGKIPVSSPQKNTPTMLQSPAHYAWFRNEVVRRDLNEWMMIGNG
ncbi:hypothetical protein B0H10DRAFT_2024737 [Mycena sp. CBHHK59/15]|nr:hypothetical protein B0H10DRAFT_2024737 [Mycena sp. CBHHK59/15]